jgi:hypothetical protein
LRRIRQSHERRQQQSKLLTLCLAPGRTLCWRAPLPINGVDFCPSLRYAPHKSERFFKSLRREGRPRREGKKAGQKPAERAQQRERSKKLQNKARRLSKQAISLGRAMFEVRRFPRVPSLTQNRRDSLAVALVFVLSIAIFIGFFSLYYNKYIGLSSDGWFLFYGKLMTEGKVPYRDFYVFSTPLHVVANYILLKLHLGTLYYMRITGALERISTGVLLMIVANRNRAILETALPVVGSMLAFSSDPSDQIFYYQSESILFAALAILCIDFAFDRNDRVRTMAWFGAGAMLGAAFLDRHHVGLVCFLSALVATGFLAYKRQFKTPGDGGRAALALIAGAFAPILLCVVILAASGGFPGFVDQIFVSGPTAKGRLTTSALRYFSILSDRWIITPAILGASAGLFLAAFRGPWFSTATPPESERRPTPIFSVVVLILLALVAACFFFLDTASQIELRAISGFVHGESRRVRFLAIDFAAFGLLYVLASAAYRSNGQVLPIHARTLAISSAIALASTYGNSLSWGRHETMIVPALPILAIVVAQIPARSRLAKGLPIAALQILGLALIVSATSMKLYRPFQFAGWQQNSVAFADTPSRQPQLAGMLFERKTTKLIDGIVDAIVTNSARDDKILAFPRIPILYVLADRDPITFAGVHHSDVADDKVTRADMETVRSAPPRVIVREVDPPDEFDNYENQFRDGARPALRDFADMLTSLLSNYHKVFEGRPTASSSPLEVWVRNDSSGLGH